MKDTTSALSTLAQNRWLMFGLTIALLALFAGSFQVGYNAGTEASKESLDTVTTESAGIDSTDEQRTTTEATDVPREPVELSGVGQMATEPIGLRSGLATVKMKHSGESNFSIWVLDQDGESVELLVNEIGNFDGSKAFQVPSDGNYVLDISADGAWQVSIKQ